jgi:hypothetical protein
MPVQIYPGRLNAERTLEVLLAIEPNAPLLYVEDINDHCKWPNIR